MKSILLGIIILLSTFSISDAFEKIYKLPNTIESRQELRLYCKAKHGKDKTLVGNCIDEQKEYLKLIWTANTIKEAEDTQRYFSFCISKTRQRVKQGIDRYGRYYELWVWIPEKTYECLIEIPKADKKKKGEGEKEAEGKLKGEPQPGRGFGNPDPNAGTI